MRTDSQISCCLAWPRKFYLLSFRGNRILRKTLKKLRFWTPFQRKSCLPLCLATCPQLIMREIDAVRALTIRQPWARAIIAGHKPVENRAGGRTSPGGAGCTARSFWITRKPSTTSIEFAGAWELIRLLKRSWSTGDHRLGRSLRLFAYRRHSSPAAHPLARRRLLLAAAQSQASTEGRPRDGQARALALRRGLRLAPVPRGTHTWSAKAKWKTSSRSTVLRRIFLEFLLGNGGELLPVGGLVAADAVLR